MKTFLLTLILSMLVSPLTFGAETSEEARAGACWLKFGPERIANLYQQVAIAEDVSVQITNANSRSLTPSGLAAASLDRDSAVARSAQLRVYKQRELAQRAALESCLKAAKDPQD